MAHGRKVVVGLGLGAAACVAYAGMGPCAATKTARLASMALAPMQVDAPFARTGDSLVAPAGAVAPTTRMEPDGRVVVGAGLESMALRLDAVGRELGTLTRVRAAAVPDRIGAAQGVAVAERDGVREWYVRASEGLEQGFDLLERPVGEGLLRLEIAVEGRTTRANRAEVELLDASGVAHGVVRDARAVDASGRALLAHLEVTSRGYAIEVDDRDARYPVRIDPFVAAPGGTLQAPAAEIAAGEGCGAAVEMVDSIVAVGCPLADVGTEAEAGEVLLFQLDAAGGSTYLGKITAEVPSRNARFGASLDFDGRRIVVGAPGEVDANAILGNVGAAYIYGSNGTTGGFTWQGTMRPPDPSGFLLFGSAVALDGDTVYVGAIGGSVGNQLASFGSVYVYALGSTIPQYQLEFGIPDPTTEDRFGESLAAHGGTVVVGAPGHDVNGLGNAGAAYIYTVNGPGGNGPTLVAPVVDATPVTAGACGASVAYDGAHILVGCPHDNGDRGMNVGSVGIFGSAGQPDGWIYAPDGATGDGFGRSVAVDGELALIGAPGIDVIGPTSKIGSAYVASHLPGTFTVSSKVRPTDAVAGDAVGFSVAVDASTNKLALGVPNDAVGNTTLAGTVRIFTVPELTLVSVEVTNGSGTGTVNSLPDGIACGLDCVEVYGPNVSLTLTAVAATDSYLASVSGDCTTSPCALVTAGGDLFGDFVFELKKDLGGACTRALECLSGICVDGVCCNDGCGAGAADCQACSVEAGGTADGQCTPLEASVAATTTCRAGRGACDAVETCDPNMHVCPPDLLLASGAVCRPAVDARCDTTESCTGTSVECPPDVVALSGVACDDGSVCNGTDRCNGQGSCLPQGSVACLDDGNPCTVDLCVDPVGCVSVPQPGCVVVDGGAVFIDAGLASDGGSDATIGPVPQPTFRGEGGCSCRAAGGSADDRVAGAAALLGLATAFVRRRRRS